MSKWVCYFEHLFLKILVRHKNVVSREKNGRVFPWNSDYFKKELKQAEWQFDSTVRLRAIEAASRFGEHGYAGIDMRDLGRRAKARTLSY